MASLRSYCLAAAITLLASAFCASGKIVEIPYYSWYDFDMSPFNTSDDSPVTCTVRMPDGEECVFEAGSGPVGTAAICRDMSYSGKPNLCKIHLINVNNHLQPYIITAEYGDQASFTEYFYLPEKVKGLPSYSKLYVVGTSHLYVRLSTNLVDMTDCSVFQYDTEFPLLDSNFSSNFVYWGKAGECGVDIEVPDDFGTAFILWTANKTHTYYSRFETTVIPSTEIFIPEEPLVLERGSNVSVGEVNSFIRTCKITTPTKRTATSVEGCTYRVDVVTDAYAGNWTFEYWVQGAMTSRVTTRLAQVVEPWPQLLVGLVTRSERFDRGIDIRCERTNGVIYNSCKFMRPDGTELDVEPGVGTQEYAYLDTCAITIVEPAQRDFGVWKCSDAANTTFVRVSNGTGSNTITSWVGEDPYFVKRGDTVELTCGMDAPLQYCWFSGPNGVLPFGTVLQAYGSSKYVYDPSLLQNGTCKLIIYNVDFEKRNTSMSCWLGVEGRSDDDYKLSVSVIISETYMTIEDLSGWRYVREEETTAVKCHSVPKGQPIEYCRFIRPDGQGISLIPGYSNVLLDNYSYHGAGLLAGDCGIQILSVSNSDIGKWTCVAMLQNDPTRESFDEYELRFGWN